MRSGHWSQLWEHFHSVLELDAEVRASWLAAHVPDPVQRAQIEDWLRAHDQVGTALDQPAARALTLPARSSQFGPWLLVHEIGRGGMGAVWLAERDDAGFVQRAALKRMSTRLADPALLARFRREQRILARLQHPEIARLLDAGIDADGLPWLAMEYIEGMPLGQWQRDCTPSLRERLHLLIRLCAAVQYAHQQLIVHRDLKPANVIVAAGQRPVLLDFGIAKLLEQDTGPDQTGTAMPVALTPRYASPEQLQGHTVGTASDVYALGCVLYELLTGDTPFAAPGPGAAWSSWVAEVCERMPPPPSARAGSLLLDRELDAITLKCLRKEPARRYASAAALGEDLQRYLDHQPVRARPDTRRYRVAKFVQRHPWGVALSALAACVLAALGLWLALERQRATQARDLALHERAHAADTVAFLTEIFREADPTRGDGRPVAAVEVLTRGADLLEHRHHAGRSAASRGSIAIALGEILVNTGAYARATALFERALAAADDPASPAALRGDALHGLGGAQLAAAAYAAARETLSKALPLRRASHGVSSLEAAMTLERLGAAEQALAHYPQAAAAYAEVLALRRLLLPADDPRIADVHLRLGALAWSRGDYAQAEHHYAGALTLRRQRPEQAAELARVLDALGALDQVRGRFASAQMHYDEALALRRRVLGAAHRLTADTLGNLGALAYDRGDPAAAVPLLEQALAVQRRALGETSPVVAKTLNNLGLAQAALGQRTQARTALEHALAINLAAFGPQHLRVAGNLNNLGLVLLDDGDATAAVERFTRALALQEAALPAADPQLGFALNNLARAWTELAQFERAKLMFARALALRRQHLDPAHPALAETLAWFGVLECEQGDAGRGRTMLDEAAALRRQTFGTAHISVAQTTVLQLACAAQPTHDAASAPDPAIARVQADPASGQPLRRRLQSVTQRAH